MSPTDGLWSLADALQAMYEWRVGPIRQWLESRACTPGGVTAADFSRMEAANWWNDGAPEIAARQAVRLVDTTRDRPETLAPMLLYLRFAGMLAWEEAWDVSSVIAAIDAVVDGLEPRLAALPEPHRADVTACARLLAFLRTEMDVFPHATTGDLGEWAAAAHAAGREAVEVAAVAALMTPGPIAHYVQTCIGEEVTYYAAVGDAAAAVAMVGHADGASAAASMDAAIRILSTAAEGEDPIDGSELRAHRLSLQALRAALDSDWLWVERAELTVVHPFGLTGTDEPVLLELARKDANGWTLAGQPVVSVRDSLPVSDLWQTVDPLGRGYRGVSMRLPEIQVRTSSGEVEYELRPELWLSELGNHLVTLIHDIDEVGPMALYDRLKLASADYCRLSVCERRIVSIIDHDGVGWDSFGEFVDDLLAHLTSYAARADLHVQTAYAAAQATGVVKITHVQAWNPTTTARRAVESGPEVATLFGSQLLTHPLSVSVNSICQWAQYPLEASSGLTARARGDLWLVRTENSAAFAEFGAPSYALDIVRDCCLFAASLDGLFQGWYTELARLNGRISQRLASVGRGLGDDGTTSLTTQEIRPFQAELENLQFRLQEFITRTRSTLLFVESPTLVMSPVMRRLLDALLGAGEYQARASSFTQSAEALAGGRLEAVLERVRTRVQDAEEAARHERDRRAKLVLESLMAGVAVAGLSGIASLLQAGYQLEALGTAMLVVTVVAISLTIAGWVWWSNRAI